MKICIIGGSGMIGSKMFQFFSKIGHEVIVTYNKHKVLNFAESYQLDITNFDETTNFLKKNNPEIIIHSSAITNIDLCETNKELAYLVNVKGTENIIEGCKKVKGKLVFLSTSYVFDGKKDQYFEDDKPTSSTYYGFTKLKGENLVTNSGWCFATAFFHSLREFLLRDFLSGDSNWYSSIFLLSCKTLFKVFELIGFKLVTVT